MSSEEVQYDMKMRESEKIKRKTNENIKKKQERIRGAREWRN